MKSLSDLQRIRDEAKKRVSMREGNQEYRIVVGMATCGIAAGARPVLTALVEEAAKSNYPVTVTQTGCIGMCTLEPIVEVFGPQGDKTTYVLVDAKKAIEILEEHIGKGKVKSEYTVGASGVAL
jgi:NADP-reducing hydrogenase subunit HndB